MAQYYSKYPIKGLDCTNCARTIEEALRNTSGMEESRINFAAGTLSIPEGRVNEARSIIRSVEDGVDIITEEEPNKSSGLILRWLISGAAATAMLLGILFHDQLARTARGWAEYALLVPAYLAVGWPVLSSALKNLFRGRVFDENFLMTIATVGAFAIGQMPEAVGVMVFYSIGENLQEMAVRRSRSSIRKLLDIRVDTARVVRNGQSVECPAESVSVGEMIVVRPGEKIPLDGRIVEGESYLDTSALTGESVPGRKGVGEEALSGMVNGEGLLTLEVIADYAHGTAAKIVELVENAADRKAPTERFITKFASVYTPVIVFLAVLLAFVPPLIIPGATLAQWTYRALILLVVSCPCALVVSIPLGYFGGLGRCSRDGILVKGANYLDVLNRVETIVFDKTGTLTHGVFEVTRIEAAPGWSEEEVLGYAARAEAGSNHPVARSIRNAAAEEYGVPEAYEEIAGRGVVTEISGRTVCAGNRALLESRGIAGIPETSTEGTLVYIAVDETCAGLIAVSDVLRDGAEEAVAGIRRQGVDSVAMLTGDSRHVAQRIADSLGINHLRAELLPGDKVEALESLSGSGAAAFVGDGINDAPVIMRADVGIAMGGMGSDAAVEAADVVIMDDDPRKVAQALGIARQTRRIVMQNVIFALLVKAVFVAVGALGDITMWQAVFADVGVALLAVFNSVRVLRVKPIRDSRGSSIWGRAIKL